MLLRQKQKFEQFNKKYSGKCSSVLFLLENLAPGDAKIGHCQQNSNFALPRGDALSVESDLRQVLVDWESPVFFDGTQKQRKKIRTTPRFLPF